MKTRLNSNKSQLELRQPTGHATVLSRVVSGNHQAHSSVLILLHRSAFTRFLCHTARSQYTCRAAHAHGNGKCPLACLLARWWVVEKVFPDNWVSTRLRGSSAGQLAYPLCSDHQSLPARPPPPVQNKKIWELIGWRGGWGANKQGIGGWKKNSWLSSEGKKKKNRATLWRQPCSWVRALWSPLWLTCVHVHSRSRAMALKHFLSSIPEPLFNENHVFQGKNRRAHHRASSNAS